MTLYLLRLGILLLYGAAPQDAVHGEAALVVVCLGEAERLIERAFASLNLRSTLTDVGDDASLAGG